MTESQVDRLLPREHAALGAAPQVLRFTSAELAVLYQVRLGEALPGGDNVLADLRISEADLQQARRDLLERALLIPTPDQADFRLAPSLWILLETVLYPQVLGILQLSRSDQPVETACVSWSNGPAIFNKVEDEGVHRLERLTTPDGVAEALLRECGLADEGAFGGGAADSPAAEAGSPKAIAERATLRALFVATLNPASSEPQAEAVSWLVSDGQLWLIAQHDDATAAMNRISRAELHGLLQAFAQLASEAAGLGEVEEA